MFTLPELPYPADVLEPYLDKETMEIHHGKHHAAYVKNLNDLLPDKSDSDLLSILKDLNSVPESIRTKVKNNGGGVINHNLFWKFMSPAKTPPSSYTLKAINPVFGNLDAFKEKFLTAALGHFGSGWAWLISEKGKLAIVTTPNQDSPYTNDLQPILGVDVWEHAYYLRYQNRRKDYLEAWWNVVNWNEVENLLSV